MLKKFLSFLSFIMIFAVSNCMEEIFPAVSQINFRYHFDQKIRNNNEQEIIAFLEKHFIYTQENLKYIFKAIFEKRQNSVIEFLRAYAKYKTKDLVSYALEARNIEWVKALTNFSNYVNDKKIDGGAFLHVLEKLDLNINVLDEICIYDKINYDLGNGYRYLQILIRANQANDKYDTILRFIKNAPAEELNATESNGSTALYIAQLLFENRVEKYKLQAKKIIETLLEHGADHKLVQAEALEDLNSICPFQFFLEPKDIEDLKEKVNHHADSMNVKAIMNLLKSESPKDQQFVRIYLPYIYKAVFNVELENVLNYMESHCLKSDEDKIRCALKINDLAKIQKLTKFTKFVTKQGTLKISEYREYLQNFTKDPMILEKILSRAGINWEDDESAQRYLSMLLQRNSLDNKYKKIILRTICVLPSAAINLQDAKTKNTALHEALYTLDRYKRNEDEQSISYMKDIIEALLRKKANLTLKNIWDIAPEDFAYFDDKKQIIAKTTPKTDHSQNLFSPEENNPLKNQVNLPESQKIEIDPTKSLNIPKAKNFFTVNKMVLCGGIALVASFILYKIFKDSSERNIFSDWKILKQYD